ncbi:MAG TPA: PilZ domain-containing protein [Bdellovibrionales bacterium]|nr:PilZ domain-containing protein [Bdellovibrionales bacterium]
MSQENRRFARVHMRMTEDTPFLAAHVVWPNEEASGLVDLSYKGMAVTKPALFAIKKDMHVPLKVEFGGRYRFNVQVRIAWINADNVGFEIVSLPPEGHQAMNAFLNAKLVGAQMRHVQRRVIDPDQSFQHWFQGPESTNVFVYVDANLRIDRVTVQLLKSTVEFWRSGKTMAPDTETERQALLVLSQMETPGLPLEEFVTALIHGD